jgi:hypothetical protein
MAAQSSAWRGAKRITITSDTSRVTHATHGELEVKETDVLLETCDGRRLGHEGHATLRNRDMRYWGRRRVNTETCTAQRRTTCARRGRFRVTQRSAKAEAARKKKRHLSGRAHEAGSYCCDDGFTQDAVT